MHCLFTEDKSANHCMPKFLIMGQYNGYHFKIGHSAFFAHIVDMNATDENQQTK